MARDDLNLKIRALVEGIQEVQQLTNEVDALQKEAGQNVPDSTQRFRKGLNSTQREARDTNRVMGDLRGTITAVAGVLGAGALGGKLLRTANEMETVNRQAEALGTTTQKMSELAFTFRQYRLQQDDVSDALGTLSDRAEDAASGMESYIEDFRLLNVEVEDLRGKRPGELFELVADRVSEIEDPTRRAAGVVRIFGDDLGRRLLPLLIKGSEELERNAEKAREVGAAYDEDAAEAGAEAARSFRELREIIDAQFTRAVANNAEELTTLAEGVAELGTNVVDFGADIVGFFSDLGSEITESQEIARYETALAGIRSEIEQITEKQQERAKTEKALREARKAGRLGEVEQFYGTTLEEVEQAQARAENRLEALRRQREILRNRGPLSGDGGDDSDSGGDDSDADTGDAGGTGSGNDDITIDQSGAPGFRGVDDQTAQQLEQARQAGELFRQTRTALEQYNTKIRQYRRLLREGEISQETYNRAVAQAEEQLASAGDQAEETGKEISEFAKQASRNIQDQLGDTLRDTLKGNFDEIEDDWRDLIFNMATEAASAQLNEWLFGTEGGFSGGAIGDLFAAIGNAGSGSGGSTGMGGSSPAAASGGSDTSWVSTLFSAIGSFFHEGGVVGEGGRPGLVPVGTWANAPRMHSGGVAGLRRDEVPIIAKKGEEVLTEDNPRHRDNAGSGGPPQFNARIVNAISEQDIANAMAGAAGEEVIMNHIARNPEIVRSSG